jgi:hypothetical protein
MSSAKAYQSVGLTAERKTTLLNDAVFYEVLFALGVSHHDSTDYCVWEHLNFSRMGHARALLYFFECTGNSEKWPANPKKRPDDLVAEDFGFPPSLLVCIPPEDRDRLNKDLFHLSCARLRHDAWSKPWTNIILNGVHAKTVEFVRFLLRPEPRDYQVNEPNWRELLDVLESRRELLISRSFEADGSDTGWLIGKGHVLDTGLSELTKLERKTTSL